MLIQTLVDLITWVISRNLKNIAVDDFEGSRAWWSDSDRLLYLIGTFGPGSSQKHSPTPLPWEMRARLGEMNLWLCNSGCGSPEYFGDSSEPVTAVYFLISTSHSLIVLPPQSHFHPGISVAKGKIEYVKLLCIATHV